MDAPKRRFSLGWSLPARILRWVLGCAVNIVLFRVIAGRWDLPWVWISIAAGSIPTLALVLTIDPNLMRERMRPGPGARDRSTNWMLMVLIVLELVLSTLDVGRLHWSDRVPTAVHVAALLLNLAGLSIVVWSVAVNRYFSSVVRIQSDRGHTLITSGPYAWVRHPGYLGMLLAYPTFGLVVGSWWSAVPGFLCGLLVLRRAIIEDPYLTQNLPGYVEYRARVRFRLVPGVW
ncbi:MAG TPA: isoprenylcysteine carboxylmethyltransferase family protein [Gemmatimonadales bacterium]|nr:isoprenylcysteine carboxylmethyltransferase family protein [Gemmatimonadales bacterium]